MSGEKQSKKLAQRSQLTKYQRDAIGLMKANPKLLTIFPMSFGKTVCSLAAFYDLYQKGEVNRVLITAPINVARATWPDEIEKWDFMQGFTYRVLRVDDNKHWKDSSFGEADDYYKREFGKGYAAVYGTERAAAFRAECERADNDALFRKLIKSNRAIHIINIEMLQKFWTFLCEEFKGKPFPYDMLIVDESTVAKNGKIMIQDKLTQMKHLSRFGVLTKIARKVKRCYCLTGTPLPHSLKNLWGQTFLLDQGERLGKSLWAFEKQYVAGGRKDKPDGTVEYRPKVMKEGALERVLAKIEDIAISLPDDALGKMPDLIYRNRYIELPKSIRKQYDDFVATLFLKELDIEAVNRSVLYGKLRQFANGMVYDEDKLAKKVMDLKLRDLDEVVKELDGDPLLVAYSFQFDKEAIKAKYKYAEVFGEGDVRDQVARWNNKEIPILLGHPASVGHGQNLQFGGNHCFWAGLTPDLELYQQFNKRLHRRGQPLPVYVMNCVAKDTVEESIVEVLSEREQTQNQVIEYFDWRKKDINLSDI